MFCAIHHNTSSIGNRQLWEEQCDWHSSYLEVLRWWVTILSKTHCKCFRRVVVFKHALQIQSQVTRDKCNLWIGMDSCNAKQKSALLSRVCVLICFVMILLLYLATPLVHRRQYHIFFIHRHRLNANMGLGQVRNLHTSPDIIGFNWS